MYGKSIRIQVPAGDNALLVSNKIKIIDEESRKQRYDIFAMTLFVQPSEPIVATLLVAELSDNDRTLPPMYAETVICHAIETYEDN